MDDDAFELLLKSGLQNLVLLWVAASALQWRSPGHKLFESAAQLSHGCVFLREVFVALRLCTLIAALSGSPALASSRLLGFLTVQASSSWLYPPTRACLFSRMSPLTGTRACYCLPPTGSGSKLRELARWLRREPQAFLFQ